MTLDIITLALLILLFLRGYSKGLVVAAFSVLAILLGITCALSLSARLSVYLMDKGWVTSALAPVLSYLLLFLAVVWLVRIVARLIDKALGTVLLGWVNKTIGGLLYAFAGLCVWSSLLWLLNYGHILPQETIVRSRTYTYVQPVAPWVFEQVGRLLPFARHSFSDLREFFNGVNQHLPEHVGTH